MVDEAKLDQMLSSVRRYVEVLKSLAQVPRAEFLGNPDKIGNAKYHFIIAIECCIDVANHVIASEGYRFPRGNADSFVVLTEEGILDAEVVDSWRGMAQFRNRLVHLYWDVDDERVYGYLQDSLVDLDRFIASIARCRW